MHDCPTNMSFNNNKVFNQIKDAITKLMNEKIALNTISSKDILRILSKINSLYDRETFKHIENKSAVVLKVLSNHASYNFPVTFKQWTTKIKSKEEVKDAQKWKRNTEIQKTSNINSKTEQLLLDIESCKSDDKLIFALEELITYIKNHPESRNRAVKNGSIRLLLRIRSKTRNNLIQEAIREGLAVFGYADPVPGQGIRILSIDGGGIRGLLVLEMLKKLEELTGKRVHELFDFFCGVSTGTLLSFAMGYHRIKLDEIIDGYESLSKEVFKQSPLWGTGNLVWSHSYYDTSLWEKKLKEYLGTTTLITTSRSPHCPKLCAISAIVNQSRVSAYVFRNYSLPWRFQSHYMGSYNHELWQAARASAAAPTYFEEFKLGTFLHQDGGILVNNPTAIAVHEAKLLWPKTPIQCVVSFGTGRSVPSPSEHSVKESPDAFINNTSWTNKFYKILDSATDTEAVHTMLSDLLPENVYFRFNPYLTEMTNMVETDSQKLTQLKLDALMYLRRNEDKFHEAAKSLMLNKKPSQKLQDFVNLQVEKYGF